MNNTTNKQQLQFELWEECNSKCSFCYLGNNNKMTPDEKKIENIDDAIRTISDLSLYNTISCLAYIGGEFFQGQMKNQKVKDKFIELMTATNALLEAELISSTWITASLLIGDQTDLYDTLKCFSDYSKVCICTSWVSVGRFYSQKEHDDWINNIAYIKKTYQGIRINITSITTGDFMQKYINDSLVLNDIVRTYKCSQFLKPPGHIEGIPTRAQVNRIIPNFFPTRQTALHFLNKFKMNESDVEYYRLFNINCRADYLKTYGHRNKFAHRIKSEYREVFDNDISVLKCSHSTQYRCYIDSDECIICDKDRILKM